MLHQPSNLPRIAIASEEGTNRSFSAVTRYILASDRRVLRAKTSGGLWERGVCVKIGKAFVAQVDGLTHEAVALGGPFVDEMFVSSLAS